MGAAPSGAGRFPDRARYRVRRPRLYTSRPIRRSALHLSRDGDPHLLARRDRAPGAGTGHRPHRPEIAGNARHRFRAQLLAPRRIADVLLDERLGAGQGRARNLVSGAQESRRYRGDLAVRHSGPVLQRRIRRRLHQHLDARRRRLFRSAVARLRGPVAHGAAACAGRRQGRLFRRSGPAHLHRDRQHATHAPWHLAAATRPGHQFAEQRLAGRHADHHRRPRVRAPHRPVQGRQCARRHADPHQQPLVPSRRHRDHQARLRRSGRHANARGRQGGARHRRHDAAGRRCDSSGQGARSADGHAAGLPARRFTSRRSVQHAERRGAFGRRFSRSRCRGDRDRAGGQPAVAGRAHRHGGRDLDTCRARRYGAVHVSIRHRPAQGVAGHAGARFGAIGRRRDHRSRDDVGEAGARLDPHARGCLCVHQHGFPDADRNARDRLRLPADCSRQVQYRRIHALDFRSVGHRADCIVARGGGADSTARLSHSCRSANVRHTKRKITNTTFTTRGFTSACVAGSAGASNGVSSCWRSPSCCSFWPWQASH